MGFPPKVLQLPIVYLVCEYTSQLRTERRGDDR